MAKTTSYEVLSKRRGKWEVESVTTNKEEAIDRANETLGTGHYQAVKVIGEELDDDTGDVKSYTVLSKEERRVSKEPSPSGKNRRKKSERRGDPNRRKKERRKKKRGGFVDFLVKVCLALWAVAATAAFLICSMDK